MLAQRLVDDWTNTINNKSKRSIKVGVFGRVGSKGNLEKLIQRALPWDWCLRVLKQEDYYCQYRNIRSAAVHGIAPGVLIQPQRGGFSQTVPA